MKFKERIIIGCGFPKSGSTYISDILFEHPEIDNKNPKEVLYFNKNFNKGESWYLSHFTNDDRYKIDFTPHYIFDQNFISRLKEFNENIKIIVIVRDPVKKLYSDYKHSIRKAEISEKIEFEEFLKIQKYFDEANYSKYLEKLFLHFDHKNIKLFSLENFIENPTYSYSELCKFIGISSTFIPPNINKPSNTGKEYRFLFIENIMTVFSKFLNNHGYGKLIEILKRLGIARFVRTLNYKSEISNEGIDLKTEKIIKEKLKSSNNFLKIASKGSIDYS